MFTTSTEDEAGSGGLWDEAGAMALQYALKRKKEHDDQPVYADELLQDILYEALHAYEAMRR